MGCVVIFLLVIAGAVPRRGQKIIKTVINDVRLATAIAAILSRHVRPTEGQVRRFLQPEYHYVNPPTKASAPASCPAGLPPANSGSDAASYFAHRRR